MAWGKVIQHHLALLDGTTKPPVGFAPTTCGSFCSRIQNRRNGYYATGAGTAFCASGDALFIAIATVAKENLSFLLSTGAVPPIIKNGIKSYYCFASPVNRWSLYPWLGTKVSPCIGRKLSSSKYCLIIRVSFRASSRTECFLSSNCLYQMRWK